ncbi:MAG: SIMPL domain-containing protein [Halobacteriaceae archaeon]
MHRRTLTVLAVAVVALTAGCLGAVDAAPTALDRHAPVQQVQPTPDARTPGASVGAGGVVAPQVAAGDGVPTVSVDATGTATAEPNAAVVRVAVEATASDANRARELVARDANRLRDAFRNAGVADADVRTTQYTVGPDYRDPRETDAPRRYRAIHAYEVRTTPDRAGRIVDVATNAGADRVDGVSFTLSAERQRELRAEAIREAVTDGRADAEALAAAAGVELDGLQHAATGGSGVIPYEARVAGGAASADTTFDPGPVRVTAHVSLTYAVA